MDQTILKKRRQAAILLATPPDSPLLEQAIETLEKLITDPDELTRYNAKLSWQAISEKIAWQRQEEQLKNSLFIRIFRNIKRK